MKIEPITNDKEFEHFCKWIARDNYGPNVFLYERHNQNGIDAYWTDKGKYYVIQSKQRSKPNASELIADLESDFNRAKEYFGADLKQFIFATTGSLEVISTKVKRINGTIESLLDVCSRLSGENSMDVIPWHWNYLEEKVLESPFLLRHLLKLEEGADLINDDFFELDSIRHRGINERECKIEYYGGKEDIQWYGIFNKWDAPREIHHNATVSIKSSFKESEPVAAIIRGDGGSGKSVLLRRLSFDLRNEYTVYWIGSDIEAFLKNELVYDVQRHPQSKYLIILEDWYRNIERTNNKAIANQLLNELKKTPNARLVIGDRKGKKKIYDEFVLSKNIYDLTNTENSGLLANIFKQMPEWENHIADDELKDITSSTLFIILFVFCYGEKNNNDSLTERYKRIFKSDYNKLLETNDTFWKGMANALYIYANLYSVYGITLSIPTIVEFARYYYNCAVPLKYQSEPSSLAVSPLLKKYIHIKNIQTRAYGTFEKMHFHHDTIAEQGWATKHDLIDVEFDENVINDLIIIIKSIKNSSDFGIFFNRLSIRPGENGKKVARNYLDTERPDRNSGTFCLCLNLLKGEDIAKQAARDFLKTDNPHVNKEAFCTCLDLLKGEDVAKRAARDFLKTGNPYLNYQTFCSCLDLLKGEEVAKQAARDFLKTDNPHVNKEAFCTCLDLLKGEDVAKRAARDFLKTGNPYLNYWAFCSCLDLLKGEDVAKQAARDFLKTDNAHVNKEAFCSCLDLLKGEDVAKRAARDFLKTDNAHVNKEAFCTCLDLLKGEDVAKQAARDFLKTDNAHVNKEAFCTCLDLLKGEDVAKRAARDFLKTDNPHLNYWAFCTCLDLLKGEDVAKQAARDFLKTDNPHLNREAFCSCLSVLGIEVESWALEIVRDYKTQNWNFVYNALKILGKTNNNNALVEKVVKEIIANKDRDWFYYKELLKISLFDIPAWVNETRFLIDNWRKQTHLGRNNLHSITFGYQEFPAKLLDMSIGIIRNWKYDLSARTKHKAYFTRCLANINIAGTEAMKKEAIQICKDIVDYKQKNRLELTPNLEEWVNKIAKTAEFPIWKFEESN